MFLKNKYLTFRNYSSSNMIDNTNTKEILKNLKLDFMDDYWDNLNNSDVKSDILDRVRNKSGVYIIINKITGSCYIGSAITNRLYTRFSNHLLHDNNGSKLVKNAINKYGLDNFIFGILEYYPDKVTRDNNKDLLLLEKAYIFALDPSYNIITEAGRSFGYKNLDEYLTNMSLSFAIDERFSILNKLIKRQKGEELEAVPDAADKQSSPIINEGKLKLMLNARLRKIVYIYDSNDLSKPLCSFYSMKKMSNYLCCSLKTVQRAVILGWIYVPNEFIPYLNDDDVNNINSIKDKFSDIDSKIKSSLNNRKPIEQTKFILKAEKANQY